jgi:hypothetical protein
LTNTDFGVNLCLFDESWEIFATLSILIIIFHHLRNLLCLFHSSQRSDL